MQVVETIDPGTDEEPRLVGENEAWTNRCSSSPLTIIQNDMYKQILGILAPLALPQACCGFYPITN